MAQCQQQQQRLLHCTEQQLDVERRLHQLACQELFLVKEKLEHEKQYELKDLHERLHNVQREMALAQTEIQQLKLDGLRQRKQNSILRLKLASAKEAVDLLQRKEVLLEQHSQRSANRVASLEGELAAAAQRLTEVSADKAILEAAVAKFQNEGLQSSMEVTRLQEELKLTSGRLNTATGQAADLLQQLKSLQAENASLMGQLAQCQGRDAEGAAAHAALQEALDGMRADLKSLRERLAVEEQARVAAEAAAAKSAAAVEAGAHALAVKEQQMAAWKDLEQATKQSVSQQMQMTQSQLDTMHKMASATEAKLLNQIAALQEQLDKERSTRYAAEASNTAVKGKTAAEQAALQVEVEGLRQQVTRVKAELAAANAAAAKEAKRAAALQQDVEHLQEQATRAAAADVDELVQGLTPDHDTEDEREQAPAQQRRAKSGAAAGRRAASAAARRKGKATGTLAATGAASTPAMQRSLFSLQPAAQLSDIAEGPEDEDGGTVQKQQQQQQPVLQQTQVDTASRLPRGAKARAQQHIKAAAAAEVTPPSNAAAAPEGGQGKPEVSRQSPHSRADARARSQAAQRDSQTTADAAPAAGPDAAAPVGEPQPKPQQQRPQPKAQPAAAAQGPPPLTFVPQSVTTPAAALQSAGVMKAAAERLSAASMLKKLNQGGVSQLSKPGARKRKLGAAAGSGSSMDVLPSDLICRPGFQPPKVRHLG